MQSKLLLTLAFIYSTSLVAASSSISFPFTEKDKEYKTIVQYSRHLDNPYIEKLFLHQNAIQERTQSELQTLINLIQTEISSADYDRTKYTVLSALESDRVNLETFTKALSHFNVGEKGTTNQIKSHKMVLAVTKAKEFLQTHFDEIWEGKLPAKYRIDPNPFVALGDAESIYGDVKGIALKTSLLRLWTVLSGKDLKDLNASMSSTFDNWIDTSAFSHLTPLPSDIDLTSLRETPYFYEENGSNFMLVIHNCYTFGGYRLEPRYADGKFYGPQDCSSGMGWLIDVPSTLMFPDTKDLLHTYRIQTGVKTLVEKADPLWPTSIIGSYLTSKLESIVVHDPQRDIRPGQIYAHRNFEEDDPTHILGSGGHTNLVLGIRSNGVPITLGWSRHPTGIADGLAIQDYPLMQGPNRTVMIFNIRK